MSKKSATTTPITTISAGLMFSVLGCANCGKNFTVINGDIINIDQRFGEHANNVYSFTHYECEEA